MTARRCGVRCAGAARARRRARADQRAAAAAGRGEERQAAADGRAPAAAAARSTPFERPRRPASYGGDLRMLMAQGPRHPHDGRSTAMRGWSATTRSCGFVPDILRELRERRRPRVHVPAAPRPPLVRRRAVHLRGLPLLLGGRRQQQGALAARPAEGAAGRRQDADGEFPDATTVRYAGTSRTRCFLPALAGAVAALHLPARALPEAVPREVRRRGEGEGAGGRGEDAQLGGLHHRRTSSTATTIPTCRRSSRGSTRRRRRRPLRVRAQSLLPPRRRRRAPAALYRPRRHRRSPTRSSIPAKTGAGEADLQARYLALRRLHVPEAQARSAATTRCGCGRRPRARSGALSRTSTSPTRSGASCCATSRFRRALSLAINRARDQRGRLFRARARRRNNTVLPQSPLFDKTYRDAWTKFDLTAANALLDELGLTERDARGLRLMPDGRRWRSSSRPPARSTEQTDVLELIRDSWRKVGIALFIAPSQREVFRKRVFSGQTHDVGLVRASRTAFRPRDMSPEELAPIDAGAAAVAAMGPVRRDAAARSGEAPDDPGGERAAAR